MIIPLELYTVECDRCKKVYSNDEYCAWIDADYALAKALSDAWIEIEDKHYCLDCYIYNEETDEYKVKN